MSELTRYLDEFVEPTLDEFRRDPLSRRRAYLACVAIYHAIDRHPAHGPGRKERDALRKAWRKSAEFATVEIAAHDFKHVLAKVREETTQRLFAERVSPAAGMLGSMGFNEGMLNDTGEVKWLVSVAEKALEFLRRKAGEPI